MIWVGKGRGRPRRERIPWRHECVEVVDRRLHVIFTANWKTTLRFQLHVYLRCVLFFGKILQKKLRHLTSVTFFWQIAFLVSSSGGSSLLVHKYSTRVVKTKYGALRGVMIHIHPPVEAFLGVPYATPPVGSLR